ncbi:MAG: TadE/TadG family type IV pilus assembly protein [Pirellulales bacterium]|jgi:Flp pilus assembly protein TadG
MRANQRHHRKGTAVSELAVCLPVITLIVFAAIQGAELMFMKQALSVAAYESCREALHPDGTKETAASTANRMLQDRRIQSAAVQFTPTDIEALAPGKYITISIHAPVTKNSTLRGWMFAPEEITSSVTMMKEYD